MIREMTEEERPREKLLNHGVQALNEVELIAILLRTGRAGHSVLDMAREVHRKILYETLNHCSDFAWSDFTEIKGIGKDKAATLCAALELGRRAILRRRTWQKEDFGRPELVAEYFYPRLSHLKHEELHACYLDNRNRLIQDIRLSSGGLDGSIVDMRSLFAPALRLGATGIILVHNHPSGDPSPSSADVRMTREIADVARPLGITLHDHIIIGKAGHASLKALKLI